MAKKIEFNVPTNEDVKGTMNEVVSRLKKNQQNKTAVIVVAAVILMMVTGLVGYMIGNKQPSFNSSQKELKTFINSKSRTVQKEIFDDLNSDDDTTYTITPIYNQENGKFTFDNNDKVLYYLIRAKGAQNNALVISYNTDSGKYKFSNYPKYAALAKATYYSKDGGFKVETVKTVDAPVFTEK